MKANSLDSDLSGQRAYNLASRLFRIPRSILGRGIRESFMLLQSESSLEWSTTSIPSGTSVGTWTVPDEWILRDAWLKHVETDTDYLQFAESNLSVLGYSQPVDLVLDISQIRSNIYTSTFPEAIPYVTSYYKPRWGLCMSKSQLDNLPPGKYHIKIDSYFSPGFLQYFEAYLPGQTKQEIMFTSYLCHPMMANNELSGPVLLHELGNFLASRSQRYFSYRFYMGPETIGAIAYLQANLSKIGHNLISGVTLSCVGDDGPYSLTHAPEETLASMAIKSACSDLNLLEYPYSSRGSDERQFAGGLASLPWCTFSRSRFGAYPEYHTSADNLDLISPLGLQGSFNVLRDVIDGFELCYIPKPYYIGEPYLSRFNLYSDLSDKCGNILDSNRRSVVEDLLAYADGNRNIFTIQQLTHHSLRSLIEAANLLVDLNLLRCSCY